MKVATANVLVGLGDDQAGAALDRVLRSRPEVVGLQEWSRARRRVLRARGQVYRLPRLRKRLGRKQPAQGYVFGYPLGGAPPVGVDAAWGEILAVRTIVLDPGRDGLRPTKACEAIVRVHATGQLHVVLNLHLVAHHDRPAYLAAWKRGKASAEDWVKSWDGYTRWVLGDTNKHLMELPPLVSCWHGNKAQATGPHGGTIDNIYGEEPASSARAVETPSDHDAVVAEYPEKETR